MIINLEVKVQTTVQILYKIDFSCIIVHTIRSDAIACKTRGGFYVSTSTTFFPWDAFSDRCSAFAPSNATEAAPLSSYIRQAAATFWS